MIGKRRKVEEGKISSHQLEAESAACVEVFIEQTTRKAENERVKKLLFSIYVCILYIHTYIHR